MAFRRKGTETLRCSFCGKAQNDIKKLIAGPNVYICNGCIDVCDEIIADDEAQAQIQRPGPPSGKVAITVTRAEPRVRCSMCRTFVLMTEGLGIPERGYLCPACIAAIRDVLD